MNRLLFIPLFFAVAFAARPAMLGDDKPDKGALPVVIWHGMGDSCCADSTTGGLAKMIEEKLGNINTGTSSSSTSDVWSSFFGNVNDQVAKVCQDLRNMNELKGGYNAIGFSQGGQFMRAVVERCNHLGPKAKTLITVGAQHQGISNIPGCMPPSLGEHETSLEDVKAVGGTCQVMQAMLARGAYSPIVRDNVVQAQYFKDPQNMDEYIKYNIFLPDVNNEQAVKKDQYKNNLASLENLVLFRFAQDTTVVPRDSAWFSFFNEDGQVVALEDLPIYKEDWIGLKTLLDSGKLVRDSIPGEHMQFSKAWFEDNIVNKYLAGKDTSDSSDTDSDSSDSDSTTDTEATSETAVDVEPKEIVPKMITIGASSI
eukprot:gene20704-27508_t